MRFDPHPGPRPDAAPLPDQPALADLRAQYYNDGFAYAGRGPAARCCWMTGLKTLAIDTGEKRTVPPPALVPEKAGECHRTARPVTSLAHSTSFQFVRASAGWSAGFDRRGRGGPGAASDAEAVLTAGAQRGGCRTAVSSPCTAMYATFFAFQAPVVTAVEGQPGSIFEQVVKAQALGQIDQGHHVLGVGPGAALLPKPYIVVAGPETAGGLLPRRAACVLEPHQTLREGVGEGCLLPSGRSTRPSQGCCRHRSGRRPPGLCHRWAASSQSHPQSHCGRA